MQIRSDPRAAEQTLVAVCDNLRDGAASLRLLAETDGSTESALLLVGSAPGAGEPERLGLAAWQVLSVPDAQDVGDGRAARLPPALSERGLDAPALQRTLAYLAAERVVLLLPAAD